jgi:hypothetical protein
MCLPQIIQAPHAVASALQRTCTKKKGRHNCLVRRAIWLQVETAGTKTRNRGNDLTDEPLPHIVAELILTVLDVNPLKPRLGF